MASATPPLLLCNSKVTNYRNKKAFKDLGHYSEWPKVADAVIEAHTRQVGGGGRPPQVTAIWSMSSTTWQGRPTQAVDSAQRLRICV
jgi:hypothetical protein